MVKYSDHEQWPNLLSRSLPKNDEVHVKEYMLIALFNNDVIELIHSINK